MTATEQLSRSELAKAGYRQAITSIQHGDLGVFRFFQPEALERFSEAFTDGWYDAKWLEQFNRDLGPHCTAHCDGVLSDFSGTEAIVSVVNEPRGLALTFVLRPEAPYIEGLPRISIRI